MASIERSQGLHYFPRNAYFSQKFPQYGVELDVPAATILSVFGLRAQVRWRIPIFVSTLICFLQSFWWPNISLLAIFFVTFTTASFFTLHFFVKEQR
jgi:hypothetical protein